MTGSWGQRRSKVPNSTMVTSPENIAKVSMPRTLRLNFFVRRPPSRTPPERPGSIAIPVQEKNTTGSSDKSRGLGTASNLRQLEPPLIHLVHIDGM